MASLFSDGNRWERRKVPAKPKKPQGKQKGKVQKTYEEQKQANIAMSHGSKRHQEFLSDSSWCSPTVPLTVPSSGKLDETPDEALRRVKAEEEAKNAAQPLTDEDIEECLDHLSLFAALPPHHSRQSIPTTPKAGRLIDRLIPASEIVELKSISEMLEICAELENNAKNANSRQDLDAEFEAVMKWGVTLARQNAEESTALIEEAREIAVRLDDSWRHWVCLSNLATVHAKHNHVEKTIAFEEKSLALAEEMGSIALKAVSLFNLAAAYHLLNYTRKALAYYAKAKEICEEVGCNEMLDIINLNVDILKVYKRRAEKKKEEAEALRQKKLKKKQQGR